MKLSVVVPALDEERRIDTCLRRLTAEPGIDEVIVVDGGSRDHTRELARAHPVTLLEAPRGRGPQLNAGAGAARGDVLLFLHVDVTLPPGAPDIVRRILTRPGVAAGAFRTWTVPEHTSSPWFRALLHLADFRSRYSGIPYGDQAIFCRRESFRAAGGFPDLPLMEDLSFSQAIRKQGRIVIARERTRVSGRRFESAPLRQTFWVNLFPALFALGVPPRLLYRIYGNPR